jgi:hypothetical protein
MGNVSGSLLALQLIAGVAGLAAMPHWAHATAELDRKYSLETIGTLRSWDNVDGLFAEYVASAYKEYFSHQSRFRLQDLSKANELLSQSKLSYAKSIEDPEILGQLARALRTQSLIRTRIFKEGPRYRFTIDWLHSPQMDVLSTETFTLQEAGAANGSLGEGSGTNNFSGLGDIKGALQAALTRMFAKVPFIGQVTGRDNAEVTVNLGAISGLKKGDTLLIATLDDVKKHPLLKQIVEWRMTPTGKVEIDSVDDALGFGHVVQEEEGHEVGRYQKITKVVPKPAPTPDSANSEGVPQPNPLEEPPKLGFAMASLWTGGFSREFSSQGGAVGKSGGGFLFGARGEGEVWFNREFFADLQLGYGGFGYSQHDIATGVDTAAGGVSGSAFTFKLDLGYTYLVTGDFFGPRAWVKAGYNVTSYTLPISADEATNPYSVKSVFLGLGGDLPVRDNYGARLELEFGLFNSGSETGGTSGSINSTHNATIFFGGYYHYKPRMLFQAGLEIQGTGSEFSSGSSLSQRTITFMPSIQYYF